jgi:hypothetical protein
MKSFEKWKIDEIERAFGIVEANSLPTMQDWLQALYDLPLQEENIVHALCQEISDYGKFWNEEDTKAFFIIPLINLIRFQQKGKYRTFMEATFGADVIDVHNNVCSLRGRVEMVVATGKQDPQTPFFFLNEYKAQRKVVTDPQGQLLIAMFAAQAKNNGLNLPVYGMYNIGEIFYFLVLVGKEYAVSKSFYATDETSLKKIVDMLKFVKAHIERNV